MCSEVAFLGETPLLLARTDERVFVWNLLTCNVWWSLRIEVTALEAVSVVVCSCVLRSNLVTHSCVQAPDLPRFACVAKGENGLLSECGVGSLPDAAYRSFSGACF